MKRICIILFLIVITLGLNAQKLKIKDGKVLIDKIPVASIEGKAGLFTLADLKYKSLDGELLFTAKWKDIKYFIPDSLCQDYLDIEFIKPYKHIKYKISGLRNTDEAISKLLLIEAPAPLIKDNALDQSAVDQFIAKYDGTEKIAADSIRYYNFENALIEKLKNSKINRDLSKPVILKVKSTTPVGSTTTVITKIDITQDNVLLGNIVKEEWSSMGIVNAKYKVFKAFQTPLIYDNVEYKMGFAAYYEAISVGTCLIMQDKFKDTGNLKFESSQNLVEYLVKKGYL